MRAPLVWRPIGRVLASGISRWVLRRTVRMNSAPPASALAQNDALQSFAHGLSVERRRCGRAPSTALRSFVHGPSVGRRGCARALSGASAAWSVIVTGAASIEMPFGAA